MSATERLSDRALNRALLARQGLLARFDLPLVEVVATIGAMQGQAWSALPAGLWSRISSFAPEILYRALERGELCWGIGIRGTLHLVSAREHPAYAVVAAQQTSTWHRAIGQTTRGMDDMRAALLVLTTAQSRTNEEIRSFAEAWVARHPDAIDAREVEAQRSLKWRPIYRWSALTRVPADGNWGNTTPADHAAAPIPPGDTRAPSPEDALEQVVRCHLRAFGPAAAEDVAHWIGWPTPRVGQLLDSLEGDLVRFQDEHGRAIYDLPDAPRPDPETPTPPRLLGAFDSMLLAYDRKRRERIVPLALRDVVYEKSNLQIRPTLLVDGLVAGTWSVDAIRRDATLTLRPAGKLTRPVRAALTAEATGLLRALQPAARAHSVTLA